MHYLCGIIHLLTTSGESPCSPSILSQCIGPNSSLTAVWVQTAQSAPVAGWARSDFERDYDRLVFSPAFRRLQNKTQVFPLPGNIFVHNRLTH